MRELGNNCKFKGDIDEILRDRFISGLKPVLQRRFFEESNTDMTLQDAIKIAIYEEASLKRKKSEQDK